MVDVFLCSGVATSVATTYNKNWQADWYALLNGQLYSHQEAICLYFLKVQGCCENYIGLHQVSHHCCIYVEGQIGIREQVHKVKLKLCIASLKITHNKTQSVHFINKLNRLYLIHVTGYKSHHTIPRFSKL